MWDLSYPYKKRKPTLENVAYCVIFILSSAFARKISIKLHACLLCETQHQTFIQFDIQIDKRH